MTPPADGLHSPGAWKPRPPPPAPPGFDADRLFGGVHWHQRWEVFRGVYTPGPNPVGELCERVGLPADLRGRRVLDVGAWHGCFSFECERRGAEEVVALSLEDPEECGFARLKEALGSRVVHFVQDSVYGLDRRALGEFDLVLFLGVLYHLRHPLLAVDRIRTVCRDTVLVETHVIDESFLVPGRAGPRASSLKRVHRCLPRVPIWRFYPGDELRGDRSSWFGPNIEAVVAAFESAGFTIRLRARWGDRATFTATAGADRPGALAGTYEAHTPNIRLAGV